MSILKSRSGFQKLFIFTFACCVAGMHFSVLFAQQRMADPAGIAKEYFSRNQQPSAGGSGAVPEALQSRFFTGLNINDNMGYSVAGAGDVNNDGFDDVIVGALYNDAGGLDAGRAYIYFGGVQFNSVADVILTRGAAGDLFGRFVSTAGDVNADGYDDVLVGAPYNDGGGTSAGRAYIYYGGAAMDNLPDVIFTGENPEDVFGSSGAAAGDVNGDGFGDVVIGAPLNNDGGTEAGKAYIFFGGQAMDANPDVVLEYNSAQSRFGAAVASAGDVNGDGYSDVIIGAYVADNSGTNAGAAYIFYGGSTMNTGADVSLFGAVADDQFGASVSSAGDVNNDGFADVVVGAPYNDQLSPAGGGAYLYFGGSSMDDVADVSMFGRNGEGLGNLVVSAGDVNGDGYSDVLLGASNNTALGNFTGRTYVFFGGAAMDSNADIVNTGAGEGNGFGWCGSFAGDFNGDGFDDYVVSAPWNGAGGSGAGRVYLYLNSLAGKDIADETYKGITANDLFGSSLANAGDVNGDGYPDLIVGAHENDVQGINAGRAYIYFGGANPDNIGDVVMTGAAAGDYFGFAVASAGDVNGDGYSDVIVGAKGNDFSANSAGSAYIFFGGTSMDGVPDVHLTGAAAFDFFGNSVAGAGDINGDGYDDVVVGAPNHDGGGADAGAAFVYFGGAAMNSTSDVILYGTAAYDYAGVTVAGPGDVNGDGYADVLLGVPGFDGSASNMGCSQIYFGGPAMDASYDVRITGYFAEESSGNAVAGAGDINGDGYPDVIIGGYNAIAPRAYVVFGGVMMDGTPDVILNSHNPSTFFGQSVAGAGDVNADGFSDVIVGAPSDYLGGYQWGGASYVYFGGRQMDNTSDIVMFGEQHYGSFGTCVAPAGDVNKDGVADIYVGANNYSIGGAALLFLSTPPPAAPRITAVKDIPNDQGGKLAVRFVRSGYDSDGQARITSYEIQRSYPPQGGQFAWQTVATITPMKEPRYAYDVDTPYDSMSGQSGTLYFRILAKTSNNNEFWKSNILSGHSVDNLPPSAVLSFAVAPQGAANKLSWRLNTEPDLKHYVIFRSPSNLIDPQTATPLALSADSVYTDSSPLAGESYYFIAAKDIHGNIGAATTSPAPHGGVSLTVFIEGLYSTASQTQVADTIKVYLRNGSAPYALIDSSTSALTSGGNAQLKFFNAPNGTYYLVIKHRNSIETWSKAGGETLAKGSSVPYSFSSSQTQAFGGNMVLKGSAWCIFSGDVNQDGIVDYSDLLAIDNDSYNFTSGYALTDLTGDSFVDYSDLVLCDNNNSNFISAVSPLALSKKGTSRLHSREVTK